MTFARRVQQAFAAHGLGSTRDAAKVTGIGHVTLHRMLQGVVPSISTVKQWAAAIAEPESAWLVWAYGDGERAEDTDADAINGNTEIPKGSIRFQVPDPPEAIVEAIAAAASNEDAVTIAFSYLLTLKDVSLGSADGGAENYQGRLAIVRLYERLTGVRLLKPEIV
ncbi:MAG: hypothetical protein IT209_00540 [Armatimonadetes bacterium]|nr:hypothetical protein [Armatimonadota bacterium]